MAFTEFYCNASTGLNTNAGDLTANGIVTSTNGAWSTVTNIFTATGGTPFSGVSVGDFCALMADGGTVAAYIARVTAIGGGGLTLTLSSTAVSGVDPTTAGVGITATTGGAWKGPNGAVNFPFGFVVGTLTNANSDPVRVNFKNNSTYSITAAITHGVAGQTVFQGYTTTPGDGGRATIDGGTSGASYVLLTVSASLNHLKDLIFQNNGATGSAAGFTTTGAQIVHERVTVTAVRGAGFTANQSGMRFVECEAYACNQSNTSGIGGFSCSGTGIIYLRCVAHDNTGSNNSGFQTSTNCVYINCVSDTNGLHGFTASASGTTFLNCVAYNNGGAGIVCSVSSAAIYVEDCVLSNNTTYGVNCSSTSVLPRLVNCGFYLNTTAETNGVNASYNTNKVSFGSAPMSDPANGEFTVTLNTGQGVGRGVFVQDPGSYSKTTTSYPDIGAVQHQCITGMLFIPNSEGT